MARRIFFFFSFLSPIIVIGLNFVWPSAIYAFYLITPVIALGIYDLYSPHNVLRIYPIIGHLRFIFEFIRPEIQQYFVATNISGRPYCRELRSLIYQRAKNIDDTHPFGTERDICSPGYEYTYHSLRVKHLNKKELHVNVGGPQCSQPYNASIINISAMSYGALSRNAIRALNRGARRAGISHNTGEGSLTPHHLDEGGDIVWQIGTAYFGCRNADGSFNPELFQQKSQHHAVKMIEVKLSQGAKPGHGGVLPAPKITKEIAEIRGITQGQDCISPATHTAFNNPIEMMHYIQKLRELSSGKPVGFKIAIGIKKEFMSLCKGMLKTGIYPDFITVDGAEGGTGAAPIVYSNRLGMPGDEAIAFVHNCLVGAGLRHHIRLISSAKVATSFDVIRRMALGADMINMARPFMFTLGCIQALHCNNNHCPTGVTSNDPARYRAINIEEKSIRVANFHRHTCNAIQALAGSMGVSQLSELCADMIQIRTSETSSTNLAKSYHFIEEGNFLSDNIHPYYGNDWQKSSASEF